MTDGTQEKAALVEAIRALRDEVAQLTERIAAMEATSHGSAGVPAAVAAGTTQAIAPAETKPAAITAAAQPEELSEDLVLVISAAIAAFLGKKPFIRQIRLVSSPTWTHQGRVSIQASHAFAVRHRSGAAK